MRSPIFDTIRRMERCVCPSTRPCDCGIDMNLPEGATCADCMHVRYCNELFGCNPTNERCDWSPSRFAPKPQAIVISPADVVRLSRGVEPC